MSMLLTKVVSCKPFLIPSYVASICRELVYNSFHPADNPSICLECVLCRNGGTDWGAYNIAPLNALRGPSAVAGW